VFTVVNAAGPPQSKLTLTGVAAMRLSATRAEHPSVRPAWATEGNVWVKRSVVAVAMPAMIKIDPKTSQTLRRLVARVKSPGRAFL